MCGLPAQRWGRAVRCARGRGELPLTVGAWRRRCAMARSGLEWRGEADGAACGIEQRLGGHRRPLGAGGDAAGAPAHRMQRHGCGSPAAGAPAPAGHRRGRTGCSRRVLACASARLRARRRVARGHAAELAARRRSRCAVTVTARSMLACCALPACADGSSIGGVHIRLHAPHPLWARMQAGGSGAAAAAHSAGAAARRARQLAPHMERPADMRLGLLGLRAVERVLAWRSELSRLLAGLEGSAPWRPAQGPPRYLRVWERGRERAWRLFVQSGRTAGCAMRARRRRPARELPRPARPAGGAQRVLSRGSARRRPVPAMSVCPTYLLLGVA